MACVEPPAVDHQCLVLAMELLLVQVEAPLLPGDIERGAHLRADSFMVSMGVSVLSCTSASSSAKRSTNLGGAEEQRRTTPETALPPEAVTSLPMRPRAFMIAAAVGANSTQARIVV